MPTVSESASRAQRDAAFTRALDKSLLLERDFSSAMIDALNEIQARLSTGDEVKDRAKLAIAARCIRRIITAWEKYPGVNVVMPGGGMITVDDYYFTAHSAVRPNKGHKSIEGSVGHALALAINEGFNLSTLEAQTLLDETIVAAKRVWLHWVEKCTVDLAEENDEEIASDTEAGPIEYTPDRSYGFADTLESHRSEQNMNLETSSRTAWREERAKSPQAQKKRARRFAPSTRGKTTWAGPWLQDEERWLKDTFCNNPTMPHPALYHAFNVRFANTAARWRPDEPVRYRSEWQPHNEGNIHDQEARKFDIGHRSFPGLQQYLEKQFTKADRDDREKNGTILTWTSTAKPNMAEDLPPRPAQRPTTSSTADDGANSSGDDEEGASFDGEEDAMLDSEEEALLDSDDQEPAVEHATGHIGRSGRAVSYHIQGWTTVNDPTKSPLPVSMESPTVGTSKKRKAKTEAGASVAKEARMISVKMSAAIKKAAALSGQVKRTEPLISGSDDGGFGTVAKEIMKDLEKSDAKISNEEAEMLREIDGGVTPE